MLAVLVRRFSKNWSPKQLSYSNWCARKIWRIEINGTTCIMKRVATSNKNSFTSKVCRGPSVRHRKRQGIERLQQQECTVCGRQF